MPGWFQAPMPHEDRVFALFRRHAETIVAGAALPAALPHHAFDPGAINDALTGAIVWNVIVGSRAARLLACMADGGFRRDADRAPSRVQTGIFLRPSLNL